MEGILKPLPWTVLRHNFKIPYIAQLPYRGPGRSFSNFPQHNGFLVAESPENLISQCPDPLSLAAFSQAWLFFELLATFLGNNIEEDSIVTNGYVTLDKEIMHDYFRRWRLTISRLSLQQRQKTKEELDSLIDTAYSKSEMFDEAANLLEPSEDLHVFDQIATSVKLLINLLSEVIDDTFAITSLHSSSYLAPWFSKLLKYSLPDRFSGNWLRIFLKVVPSSILDMQLRQPTSLLQQQPSTLRPIPPGAQSYCRATNFLLRQFIQNGWCPERATQLCRSYDYLMLNNLAMLVNSRSADEDHSECVDSRKCSAYNLKLGNPEEYPFRHACETERYCEFVHIPIDEISNIIMEGEIPLVSMNIEGELDLQVVKCNPYLVYSAISHVWSDGLGNPISNALPKCQLVRIRNLISESYQPENSPFYDGTSLTSQLRSTGAWMNYNMWGAKRPYSKFDNQRVFFWMDTLCIPVRTGSTTAEGKELKFRAIKHITPVFAGAYNTIVLDKSLETILCPDITQLCGDEFAALIIGSKWMQRGWTLEESSLSSNCSFQIENKQFPAYQSLEHLLPPTEPHHSPLERISLNTRRWTTRVLGRALSNDSNAISTNPQTSKAQRFLRVLRVSQFVWIWNSLLDRSLTKSEDGPLILANLLDFNVYSLKPLSNEDRLKTVIQSCAELPLSILYNTGPKLSLENHPEIGWIPRFIEGDYLVTGAALRRIDTKPSEARLKYYIDRSNSEMTSLLMLETSSLQHIPCDLETFSIEVAVGKDNAVKKYIIQVQRSTSQNPPRSGRQQHADEDFRESQGACIIIIDFNCGDRSARGHAARGACFCVDARKKAGMVITYDSPIIAFSQRQWKLRIESPLAVPCFKMRHIQRNVQLVLSYDKSIWSGNLIRRPLGATVPYGASYISVIVTMFLGLLTAYYITWLILQFLGLFGFKGGIPFLFIIILYLVTPFFLVFVGDPIRQRLAMYRYVSWLKSFDDRPIQRSGLRKALQGLGSKLKDRCTRLLKPDIERGVTQVNIDLSRLNRQARSAEFPGEVYLE